MVESILKGKTILAVDDEPDVLTVLEKGINQLSSRGPSDQKINHEGVFSWPSPF